MSMFMNLWSRRGCAAFLTLSGSIGGTACSDAKHADAAAGEATVAPDSMGASLADVATVVIRTSRNLRESSALAMSASRPGVLYTINDSGNEPILFALDTTGSDRGAWRVKKSTNVDWEALAIGACAARS